jgi:hypothetical protein
VEIGLQSNFHKSEVLVYFLARTTLLVVHVFREDIILYAHIVFFFLKS